MSPRSNARGGGSHDSLQSRRGSYTDNQSQQQERILWDEKAVRELLKKPHRFRFRDPLHAYDLERRGGLPMFYYLWESCPLTAAQRELLDLLRQYPARSVAFYRCALHIGKSAYHERLRLLCERLAEHLNNADQLDTGESACCYQGLPAPPTSLIGREEEIAAICALMSRPDVRLLTLSGPAGSGKTRLSIEVASRILPSFPDGVYFVTLASINDPALVEKAIAEALRIDYAGEAQTLQWIKDYVRTRTLLLVIDNFEHLLSASCIVSDLLAVASRLKILATSREILRLSGEHEFPVPPLSLPHQSELCRIPFEALCKYDALRLFEVRAKAINANFQLTPDNVPDVAAICARLDGLPLAIELAAARCRVLTPRELLPLLDDQLAVLEGRSLDVPGRQQSLREAIDWSYRLLLPSEQRLFACLAVFAGGCTLPAAQAVCAGADDMDFAILEGLTSLIEKSLLSREIDPDGTPRFRMLETIRKYAHEHLAAFDDREDVYRRFAGHYLQLVEQAAQARGDDSWNGWLNRLEGEYDNVLAALAWAIDQGDAQMALRFVEALRPCWQERSHLGERWQRTAAARFAA
ncbi:MAG: hypothetical protein KatS3mg057_2674 [Herpetosiphonaceae bacterium]|nr:MAG: hypothetical protein KatS3mg057_2674 [Herpetosiphonaceae bacterium]